MSNILSPSQLGQMADLREQGLSYQRISQWFADRGTFVSLQTIAWQCVKLGLIGPYTRANMGRTVSRGRAFTAEEDARLLELSIAGARRKDMEAALGRPRSSIIARLYILARNEGLEEAA